MDFMRQDDENFLINTVGDNKTIDAIKENIRLSSQIVKTINDDVGLTTLKVKVLTMTNKTRGIGLTWDGSIIKINLSELELVERNRVKEDICLLTRELVSQKRKLLVYKFENDKLDYKMTSSVIHEKKLRNIKNELRRIEKIEEERERIELKEYMKEIREKQIVDLKNKLSKANSDNNELRNKLFEEVSESEKINEKLNKDFKEMTDIKTKLNDLLSLRKKLEDSKKAVISLIKDQPNKNEYLSEMKTNGFILSYAGCLKIALKRSISSKDIIHKDKGDDVESVINVIKLQESVYSMRLKKLEMSANEDFDDEVNDDFEYD